MNRSPVIILGAGGHAKVVLAALVCAGYEVLGLTDSDSAKHGATILDVPVLGPDEAILNYGVTDVQLANGIGSIGKSDARRRVFEKFTGLGFRFTVLVHPSAVVAADSVLGDGAQVMAGAVIQPGCRIGRNAIINTGATVDHDADIGEHVHVSPGATVCGNVIIRPLAHVGAGATVIQNIIVGAGAVVAAGAVVVENVPPAAVVAGIPARVTHR